MAEYSVRIEDTAASATLSKAAWSTVTIRVKAVSAKHAMAKAERGIGNKQEYYGSGQYRAKSAQLVPAKFAERDYWRKIWAKAYDNIPTRTYVKERQDWIEQPRNSVPLPVFIREKAHGRMVQSEDGVIRKLKIIRTPYKMGALAALTKLLQYAKWNRQHSMAHYAVANAMTRGSRPSTPERRELLIKLAGPNGLAIAAEMLDRPYQRLKIKGAK